MISGWVLELEDTGDNSSQLFKYLAFAD